MASLRVYRFKMNFYSGQSRFVRDKKEKKKKWKRNFNVKTHVGAIRIALVESCGMKRSCFLLDTRHFFPCKRHIQNAFVFSISFLFFQDDGNRDVSNRNDLFFLV